MCTCRSLSNSCGGGERALPYVGRYHLPVKRPPFIYAKLAPNDPIFHYSPHPMIPFFQISNFLRVSHAFQKFCQFSAKNGNVLLNFDKFYTKRPPIWEDHTKKDSIFLDPRRNAMANVFVYQ